MCSNLQILQDTFKCVFTDFYTEPENQEASSEIKLCVTVVPTKYQGQHRSMILCGTSFNLLVE